MWIRWLEDCARPHLVEAAVSEAEPDRDTPHAQPVEIVETDALGEAENE